MQGEVMDDLDAILEAGLASYVEAETQLGFEERIVRRVLMQERQRGPQWWPWMAAACTALIVAVAWFSCGRSYPVPPAAVAVKTPPVAAAPVGEDRGTRERANIAASPTGEIAKSTSKERRVLREGQSQGVLSAADSTDFISTAPVTAEERGILLAVQHHPAEVSRAMREASEQSSEPIRIAAIQVDKLQVGNQKEEE